MSIKTIWMKIMEKIHNEEKIPNALPVLIKCGDVKIVPFMSNITNIIRILRHKIFYRKLKINSMSIKTGNDEYIMTQKDHKCRYRKCDFHLSTPLEFSCT